MEGLDAGKFFYEEETSSAEEGSSEGGSSSGNEVVRSMIENSEGLPKIGDSARTLGVRRGVDIPVDNNGIVYPNTGGMSVSPDVDGLPSHRKPPEYGGTGKDPVWKINIGDLGDDLVYIPDSPTHGTIQPSRPMTFDEYQDALAKTMKKWSKK